MSSGVQQLLGSAWTKNTSIGSFRAFFSAHGQLRRKDFLARFPCPFLMSTANTDPLTWGKALLVKIEKRAPTQGKIAISARTLGDLEDGPPSTIHVGRAPDNDVVLPFASVSKRHAYFLQKDEHWSIGDAGSSNGTVLDGKELRPRHTTKIPGPLSRIELGPDARFLFFTPEALHDFIREARRVNGIGELTPDPIRRPLSIEECLPYDEEDFASLARIPVEDAAFSRVISLDSGQESPVLLSDGAALDETETGTRATRRVPIVKDTAPVLRCPDLDGDAESFSQAIAAIEKLASLIQTIELSIDKGEQHVVYGIAADDRLETAVAKIRSLRDSLVGIRVTLRVGDQKPIQLYVRKPS